VRKTAYFGKVDEGLGKLLEEDFQKNGMQAE
jgi:hypothetical protein